MDRDSPTKLTERSANDPRAKLKRQEKLWELMGEYIGHDKTSI